MSARDDRFTPSDDPVRTCLLAARRPEAFLEKWREASERVIGGARLLEAEVVQTHYVPGKAGRLFIHARIGRRENHRRRRYVSLQVYRTPEHALRRVAAVERGKPPRRSTGPPFFAIPEWNAVAWELPNGPRLRGLRTFMQRKALRRFLERARLERLAEPRLYRPKLIRYVPRRRAVFRWKQGPAMGGNPVFVKLYAPGGDLDAVRNMALLSSPGCELGPLVVPELLHHEASRRAVLMKGLPGDRFTTLVPRSDERQLRAVAAALASFHSCGVMPPRAWEPRLELEALERAMSDVALALPGTSRHLARLVSSLGREMDAIGRWDRRPIHGNLFGDQILLDGTDVALVDWDDLAAGDPLFDLARLLAHVRYATAVDCPAAGERACRVLLDAYAEASPDPMPERRLRLHQACALLLRMKIDGLRKLPEGWEQQIAWTIERVEDLLARGAAS